MRPMVGRAREIHDSTDAFERAVADQAGQLVTIGQTVLIGGGVGRRYLAPARATRLFEGFAKGMFYPGPPLVRQQFRLSGDQGQRQGRMMEPEGRPSEGVRGDR
jgi:hypothetical protein